MRKTKLIRAKKKRNFSELADQDYNHTLSPEDAAWNRKFSNEYYNAQGLSSEAAIHKTKKAKNKARRDRYAAEREVDLTLNEQGAINTAQSEDPTDLLIALYDLKFNKTK